MKFRPLFLRSRFLTLVGTLSKILGKLIEANKSHLIDDSVSAIFYIFDTISLQYNRFNSCSDCYS